ncbi:glutamate receptor ionotropic, kainate glr-3-like [Centruroides vittatus]|uniref:glutamate receptor ionotropic, kainate glr-3-like n=1 Tax=Centruroides vittatus TaxID=120091 RepID=UPI003510CCF8
MPKVLSSKSSLLNSNIAEFVEPKILIADGQILHSDDYDARIVCNRKSQIRQYIQTAKHMNRENCGEMPSNPAWMSFTKSKKQITQTWFLDIIKILQEQLNFRYEVVHPLPLDSGKREENGFYSGMIGQIVNKVADITGIPVRFIPHIPADYTPAIVVNPVKFIVAERKLKSDWEDVIRPFSLRLWIALGISMVLLGIILPKIMNSGQNIKKTKHFWTIKRAMLFLIASCSMKGTNLGNTTSCSARLSIGICLFSTSILGFAYAGTLISFLTTPSYEPAPKTINELAAAVKLGKYFCGTYSQKAISKYLKGRKSAETEILIDYMKRNPDKLTPYATVIASKMKNERYAFISSEIFASGRIMPLFQGKSSLSEDNFMTIVAGYLIRKDFPYKRSINKM